MSKKTVTTINIRQDVKDIGHVLAKREGISFSYLVSLMIENQYDCIIKEVMKEKGCSRESAIFIIKNYDKK